MELTNCLKFSYLGDLRYIICDIGSCYENIVNLLMERFNIPKEYKPALQIANISGYIFERRLFEYFLQLFPCPKIIFYVRFDCSKLAINTINKNEEKEQPPSKVNHKRKLEANQEEISQYPAVAVYRQNCFCGVLPRNVGKVDKNESIQSSIPKRRRLMDIGNCKSKISTPALKRIIRI